MGADYDPAPDDKILCEAMRIEVASYGLVPFFGWTNYYNYVVKGRWKTSPYQVCEYYPDPAWMFNGRANELAWVDHPDQAFR